VTKWNPSSNDNCVTGLEWSPTRTADRFVTGVGPSSFAAALDSTATETITRLYTYSDRYVPGASDVIDIYREQDLVPVRPQVDTFRYSGDATSGRFLRPTGARWYSSTSVTENVNQARMTAASDTWVNLVDDDPFVPGTYVGKVSTFPQAFTDPAPIINRQFIGLVAAGFASTDPSYTSSRSSWAFQVDGLTTNTSGRRILAVTMSCLCERLIDARDRGSDFDQPYYVRPFLNIGGVSSPGERRLMPSTPTEVSYTWFQNPRTGAAWTGADLDAFAVATPTNSVVWTMYRPPSQPEVWNNTAGAIYRATISVVHCEETRVAQARRASTSQNIGWNRWNVTDLTGSPGWAKDDAERYLLNDRLFRNESVAWRPTLSSEGLSVRCLTGDERGPDVAGLYEVAPTFIDSVPRNVGDQTGAVPAMLLATSTDLSDDSNPYALVTDFAELGVVRDPGQSLLQQVVVLPDNDGPDVVRFYARSETAERPAGELGLQLFDGSFVLAGASVVATPDDLVRPDVWQLFEVDFSCAADLSTYDGPAYLAEFGLQGPQGVGWQVLTLTDGTYDAGVAVPDSITPTATVGYEPGTAAAAGGDPYAVRSDGTVYVNFGRRPPIPNDITYNYDAADPNGPCWVIGWDGEPGWDPTPDCADVIGYDIERAVWNPVDGMFEPWVQVFRFDVDGTEDRYWARDYEAPRNLPVLYRIRVQASTGFTSVWDESDELEPDADELCGYWFTTNREPALNVWVDDIGNRNYGFTERVSYYEFEGVDGRVEARGLTDLLDRFNLDLFIAGKNATAPTDDPRDLSYLGRWVFDRVTVLSGNKRDRTTGVLYRLPYVAVKDQHGRVWFSSLETPQGLRREPAGQYRLEMTVVETTRTPERTVLDDDAAALVPPWGGS